MTIYVVKDTNMQVGWAGSLSNHFAMYLPPSAALRIKLLGAAPKKSPVQVDLGLPWPSLICSPIFSTFFHRASESRAFGPKMETTAFDSQAPYAPVPAPVAPTTPSATPTARPPLPSRIRSPPGGGAVNGHAADEGGLGKAKVV